MTATTRLEDRCEPWCVEHQDTAEASYRKSRTVSIRGVSAFVANKPTGEEGEQMQALYIETASDDAGLGVIDVVTFAHEIERLARTCYTAAVSALRSRNANAW